jgi:hypothetical protein
MRNELLVLVDKTLLKEQPEPSSKQVRDAQEKGSLKGLWAKARDAKLQFDADRSKFPELENAVKEFFDWEKKNSRVATLQSPPNQEIADALGKLLVSMRESGVYILSKGAIEDYYPAGAIAGRDKPSKAQCYRNVVTTRDQVVANCPIIRVGANGVTKPELELICEAIFK